MARRGWGEGSLCRRVVRRGDREYVYWRAILPGGPFGSRREFQNRSERVTRAWLRNNIARLDRGLPIGGERVTIGAYAVDWLKDTSLTVRPATVDFYRAALRHLDGLADVPVAALTTAHVRGLIKAASEKGLSSRTTRGIVQTLNLVLRRAQADGITERNVASLVRLPKLEQEDPRHFTAEQARRFLDAARDEPIGSLYAIALYTGLRRGELLALTWRDVDLDGGTVAVRRSKTAAGLRSVPLPAPAISALRRHDRGPGPIWPYSPEYVSRRFKELCEKAGVPALTMHSTRHTAASLMLDAGVDPLTIQAILGHTRVSMTSHYARSGDELRRDAVERLGGTIAGHKAATR